MRILIFGSTGGVGRELVGQALNQGHIVTAFARPSAKLDINDRSLEIVQGDVMDLPAVQRAIPGHDAVLAALGSPPVRNTKVRSEGTRHIIRAMETAGTRRLVSVSTLGVGDSWQLLPRKYKVAFRSLLRNVLAAHRQQELYLAQSALDWTIVRPGAYVEGGHTGQYRYGFASTDQTIRAEISRADVADFMLKQLADDTYIRCTPGVSYSSTSYSNSLESRNGRVPR